MSLAGKSGLPTVGPQWFAPVMGWAGLGLAWYRAQAVLGPTARDVSAALAVVAALVFSLVAIAIVLRSVRHPGSLGEDLSHPVRHAFAAAFPISILLLATLGHAHGVEAGAVAIAWTAGAALEAVVTAWVLVRIVQGGLKWPAITPILFIPIVGNVVVPLAGAGIGQAPLSWAFLGVGAFLWPVVLTLIFARTAVQPIPERLLPSWFITIAPPAVIGLSAMNLGAGHGAGAAMLGVASVFLVVSLGMLRRIGAQPFGMPHWAASFPLAAIAALACALAGQYAALRLPALAVLALASIVVVYLTVATLRGLRDGSLLMPEPAAPIVAAKS